MGICPLKGRDGSTQPNPEEPSILEETHYYAFLSQIRQSFAKRSSYQNPEVICHAHEMPKRPQPPARKPEPVPIVQTMQPFKSEYLAKPEQMPGLDKGLPTIQPTMQPLAA